MIEKVFYDINDDIAQIRNTVFILEQKIKKEDEYEGSENEYIHFAFYEKDLIIAYARLRDNHIGRVCVLKEYRGLGYGKNILKKAEIEAYKRNYKYVELNAQISVKDFYLKLGYIPEGSPFLEAGILHLKMKKFL
ncbi:MAG: GNAT family N-acetyltransferase [Bacillales bacterium]|jgi:predicted GNAT family N-acyltransferase|nr:GNAT family N-acetyltransferase [Bacillales bacterium]